MTGLASFRVGTATVVYFGGRISDRAWLLSRGVAGDAQPSVVLDIAPDLPADAWNEVLKYFPRRQVRVVAAHIEPDEVLRMGRWLATRLGEPVVVSTGVPEPAGNLAWFRLEPVGARPRKRQQPGRWWHRAA
ncbi:hypothetical protein VSH64_37445 [Amycolatopsis rhabdoformis]|uniref:MBL fold metallo-hydrolase n=1 Tax=Amycolatopsis rhabdoformis TaxID=1448059 RepID=A0ABZ1I2P9_9PSEU|nr:hypothetical protein [Amycolatopsis rhabdoformis]WSE28475.1 hypothetical protein VSH64_37445 [Amycolatopsis rhabdoformis]